MHAELLDEVRRGDAIVFCNEKLTQILGIYGVVDEPFADKEPVTTTEGLDVTEAFAHRVQLQESCMACRVVDMERLLPVLNLFPEGVEWSAQLEGCPLIPLKARDYRIVRRELESPAVNEQEIADVHPKRLGKPERWARENRRA